VTAALVSASFVLLGLVLDQGVAGPKRIFTAVLIILIGVLNLAVVRLHYNRFDMHAAIARAARDMVAQVTIDGRTEKRGYRWLGWLVVAGLAVVAGIGLLVLEKLCSASLLPSCRRSP